jgi:hypothetical protein
MQKMWIIQHGIHTSFNSANDVLSSAVLLMRVWHREPMLNPSRRKFRSEHLIQKFSSIVRAEGNNTQT